MMPNTINPLVLATLALLVAGCRPVAAPDTSTTTATTASSLLAGWYLQDATQAALQPCGLDRELRVVDGRALREQARAFGLQDGDPVYVKVEGVRDAGSFTLRRVVQFGSPTPVRDCPMTGSRIQ